MTAALARIAYRYKRAISGPNRLLLGRTPYRSQVSNDWLAQRGRKCDHWDPVSYFLRVRPMIVASCMARHQPSLPAGIYWLPGRLHGLEALMARAPDGEITFRTVEPGTDGGYEIGQLESWLKDRGFKPDDDAGPMLFLA